MVSCQSGTCPPPSSPVVQGRLVLVERDVLQPAQPAVVARHALQLALGPAGRHVGVTLQGVQRLVAHGVGADAPGTHGLQAVAGIVRRVGVADQHIDAEVAQAVPAGQGDGVGHRRLGRHAVEREPHLRRLQLGDPPARGAA